jgi:Ca2+/Na+ antiporter
MLEQVKQFYTKIEPYLHVKKPWDSFIIFVLNILIAIPLFIIIHQNLIDLNWFFQLDRILIFIILLIAIQLLLIVLRKVTLISILIYLLFLIYGTLFGNYGFNRVFEDYRAMIFAMKNNPNPQDIFISKLLPFPNKNLVIKSVDFTNPKVRNFALYATTKHFVDFKTNEKNRRMVQCFAVFKEIKNRWNYVNDPIGREYIARASESLQHFSGDCDDHSILMAACIKAIGGTPRLIHTGGHIYPEMLIGNQADLELAIFLIKDKLFVKESDAKQIHYHIDERGQIWLNLDYTATYPGGPFMSEEILGALTL